MIVQHDFGKYSPSLTSLRKMLRVDSKAGATIVVFERGEQQSTFVKHANTGRWTHNGNGLLRAAYRLANVLDAEWYECRDSGKPFKL